MDDSLHYETYLYVSSNKLIISVYNEFNEKIYEKILELKKDIKITLIEKLDSFLKENIFTIEKKLNNFVKKIDVILDLDEFLPVEISVKKNTYDKNNNSKILNHLLNEAKNYCKKTLEERKIIHMVIKNYQIDNKNFSFLNNDISEKNFSLDVKFICISNNLIRNLEESLKKYQISLGQVVSFNYIKKFLTIDNSDIFLMAKKIIDGHNPNEVKLATKINKNKGFFEKFFNFFN